jgi:hypothetical protein
MKIARECIACGSTSLLKTPAILAPFVAARVFGWTPVEITEAWGFRDIRPGNAYSICNTIFCPRCEMIFCDIRFDADEMKALYGGYRDEAYTSLRERFEPGYRQRNAALEEEATYLPLVERFLSPHVVQSPRILDWGGGSGVNTPFRRAAAIHHIFDISCTQPVGGATNVTEDEVYSHRYDLIVLSEVLEHVPYPGEMLRNVAGAMSGETALYIEVPREDLVAMATNIGEQWPAKRHWHEHINFFSERSLGCLLAAHGLAVMASTTFEVVTGLKRGTAFAIVATRTG